MSARTKIDPGWKWDDDFIMSQAIQIGNAIYVSGQVALDPAGNILGKGDMKPDTPGSRKRSNRTPRRRCFTPGRSQDHRFHYGHQPSDGDARSPSRILSGAPAGQHRGRGQSAGFPGPPDRD